MGPIPAGGTASTSNVAKANAALARHMKLEFSAGGIVVKKENSEILVLICHHSRYHHLGFPKGHIGDKIKGETKEQAAVREVKEETGAEAVILKELQPITYFYTFEGEKRKKTVYFFLMKYVGGDITQHDFETEKVEWVLADQIEKTITYKDEKEAFNEAQRYFSLI